MVDYVLKQLYDRRKQIGRGEIINFSPATFNPSPYLFTRIGDGSIGGKGRGLGFINAIIAQFNLENKFPEIQIGVPPTLVLTTDIFDQFMEDSNLFDISLNRNTSDELMLESFMKFGTFRQPIISDLKVFLQRIRFPLAVRSSSLFEDTFRQPFAGVYKTHILSNQGDIDKRLEELLKAIKSIFASTFFQEAKSYVESTSYRTEEMKMAVVIQELIGRKHDQYYYPDSAGIARTINFYPSSSEKAEDGICLSVLGLGGTVVDGGSCVRFSTNPNQVHFTENQKISGVAMKNLQQNFVALDMTRSCFERDLQNQNIVQLDLSTAAKHGTLSHCGSLFYENSKTFQHLPYTQSNGNDHKKSQQVKIDPSFFDKDVHGLPYFSPIIPGKTHTTEKQEMVQYQSQSLEKPSSVVTFSNLLNDKGIPFREVISSLLKIGSEGFSCPVEIEYAFTLSDNPTIPHRFSVLQIRPMSNWKAQSHFGVDILPSEDLAICTCKSALGNGKLENIKDIIFVSNFDSNHVKEITNEIERFNHTMLTEKRPYILISPGRFGTKDPKRGIPLNWKQMNGVTCLVETELDGNDILPSEGTHFFQNITSFGIGYLNILSKDIGSIDYQWLNSLANQQKISQGFNFVKRVTFEKPLECMIDGISRCAVIMKPEHNFNSVLQANAFISLEKLASKL